MFAPNFTREELVRSRTAKAKEINNNPTRDQERNLERVSWFLQAIKMTLSARFKTNVIISVSSGFRSKALNDELSGSQTSAHMDGLAADITCSHMSPFILAKFIEQEMRGLGYDQVIQEHGRWVHVGLTKVNNKLESLTAKRVSGKTIYSRGLRDE